MYQVDCVIYNKNRDCLTCTKLTFLYVPGTVTVLYVPRKGEYVGEVGDLEGDGRQREVRQVERIPLLGQLPERKRKIERARERERDRQRVCVRESERERERASERARERARELCVCEREGVSDHARPQVRGSHATCRAQWLQLLYFWRVL